MVSSPIGYANGTQVAVISTEHIVCTAVVAGVFSFHVDLSNMASGDSIVLRIYQKILTGDTPMVAYFQPFNDAQPVDGLIAVSVPIANELQELDCLRFTLTQTAGTPKSFKWKVLRY
jgi:hypothetical protein